MIVKSSARAEHLTAFVLVTQPHSKCRNTKILAVRRSAVLAYFSNEACLDCEASLLGGSMPSLTNMKTRLGIVS